MLKYCHTIELKLILHSDMIIVRDIEGQSKFSDFCETFNASFISVKKLIEFITFACFTCTIFSNFDITLSYEVLVYIWTCLAVMRDKKLANAPHCKHISSRM